MSFDLSVFERTKAPKTHEEFLSWFSEQTQWDEERDYNSIEGISSPLAAWFMEMKETFSPLNGPYCLSDDEAFADADTENHMTDYCIGSDIIYAAFGWSVAEEAARLAQTLAEKHGVGFFNPQTGEVCCDSIISCIMTTENGGDKPAVWEQIEREILTLDDPARGDSDRNTAFITLSFWNNDTDHEFMQCSPNYIKRESFFKRMLGTSKKAEHDRLSYSVEVGTGEKIYARQIASKEQVKQVFRDYYVSRRLPDITDWQDTGIL